MSKRPTNVYPHSKASGSYGTLERKHTGKREAEAQALLKAARKLQDLQNGWDKRSPSIIEETLKYNRALWVLFYDHAVSNDPKSQQPEALKTNIVNLAGFIFKRSMDILVEPKPEKLSILISINREVAAGLMAKRIA